MCGLIISGTLFTIILLHPEYFTDIPFESFDYRIIFSKQYLHTAILITLASVISYGIGVIQNTPQDIFSIKKTYYICNNTLKTFLIKQATIFKI